MINGELKLRIRVQEKDTNSEELDELVYNFKSDLKNLLVDVNELKNDIDEASGIKGDPITIGALIILLSPIALKSLFDFIQNWVIKTRKVSIEAPNGAKIEFTSDRRYSEDELIDLINKLNKIK